MFEGLAQDLKYALRHLGRSRVFALGAALTLAFGIGANAAMFSVLNALVLRSLPIKDPGGLIGISAVNVRGQSRPTLIPAVDILKDGPLEGICAYSGAPILATEVNGSPTQAVVEFVTDRCLPTIGVQPFVGRVFTAEEAPASRPGAKVVLIGYRFWQRMFGGAPDVIGRTLRSEADEVTVIGVMPNGFMGLQVDTGVDIIAPFGILVPYPANRPPAATYLLGRLRNGITLEAAQSELAARWPALLERVIPATLSASERSNLRDVTVRAAVIGRGLSFLRNRYERPLWIIITLTSLLLLLACVNLGGLLLSRLAARGQELALRTALGGSTLRIVRQLVAETLIVAAAGTVLAFGVAWAVIGPLSSMLPFGLVDPAVRITPDVRVFLVTTIAGLMAGLLSSVLPVWVSTRRRTVSSFQWDRTIAGSTGRYGKALLVVQVALSVVLLMGAGLLARSLRTLLNTDPGFPTARVLSARLMPLPGAYRARDFDAASYYPLLVERLAALPGVRSVGYARAFPHAYNDDVGRNSIGFVGSPPGDLTAQLEIVSPGFFETVGVPLVQGRTVTWYDTAKTTPVAVISESVARALGGDVLGRHIRFGSDPIFQDTEIVGVVRNASLGNLRSTAPQVFYSPALQVGPYGYYPTIEIATTGEPLLLAEAVRQTVRSLGREYVHDIARLDERFSRSVAAERLSATLAAAVATLAALIAFIGLYSLFAYTVVRRTREIGVRVAIGAAPRAMQLLVLRESVLLTVAGIAIGIPSGIAAGRALRSLLFGITQADPLTLTAVAVFFLLLAVTAGMIPARRAANVDPAVALRAE